MSNLWQDLRYGVRMLAKNPGFTAIAVLTLAIGIGANTAMFSVVNAVLLRPLAYREPNRIVTIASLWKETGHHGPVSAPDFHDWHDQATAFASMAYYETTTAPCHRARAANTRTVPWLRPNSFTSSSPSRRGVTSSRRMSKKPAPRLFPILIGASDSVAIRQHSDRVSRFLDGA